MYVVVDLTTVLSEKPGRLKATHRNISRGDGDKKHFKLKI